MLVAVYAAAVLVAGAMGAEGQSAAATADKGRILLVLPFDNRTGQPNLEWMREAAAEILSARFRSAGFSPMNRADPVSYTHLDVYKRQGGRRGRGGRAAAD